MNIRDCLLLELLRSENLDSSDSSCAPEGVQGLKRQGRNNVGSPREMDWSTGIRERETKARRRGTGKWKNYEAALMNVRGREMLSKNSAQRVNIINFLEEWWWSLRADFEA